MRILQLQHILSLIHLADNITDKVLENRCWTTSSAGCLGNGEKPVNKWYEERDSYDPSNPVASHFTQLVWKASTNVGCGYVNYLYVDNGTNKYYSVVVCNYYLSGNFKGSYGTNVTP